MGGGWRALPVVASAQGSHVTPSGSPTAAATRALRDFSLWICAHHIGSFFSVRHLP